MDRGDLGHAIERHGDTERSGGGAGELLADPRRGDRSGLRDWRARPRVRARACRALAAEAADVPSTPTDASVSAALRLSPGSPAKGICCPSGNAQPPTEGMSCRSSLEPDRKSTRLN